jgi:large subunit ribosomal protein L29
MDKYSDLIKLNEKELFEKVALLRKESLNLRFQKSSGQLEKTARVRQVKKQIARLKTAITAIKMKGKK